LASGELRRQIGIKLRAENTCNLVYAMWHIEPDARVAVSIKHNPDMSTHEQCYPGGYINLQQSEESRRQKSFPGKPTDGVEAWHGDLGPVIASFDGPVGLRTDNARFAFDYFVGPATPGPATPDCRQTPGD